MCSQIERSTTYFFHVYVFSQIAKQILCKCSSYLIKQLAFIIHTLKTFRVNEVVSFCKTKSSIVFWNLWVQNEIILDIIFTYLVFSVTGLSLLFSALLVMQYLAINLHPYSSCLSYKMWRFSVWYSIHVMKPWCLHCNLLVGTLVWGCSPLKQEGENIEIFIRWYRSKPGSNTDVISTR